MVTGESLPVKKQQGDEVIGPRLTKQAALGGQHEWAKICFCQIVQLVQQAPGLKAPIQRLADQVTGCGFVPVVITSRRHLIRFDVMGSLTLA